MFCSSKHFLQLGVQRARCRQIVTERLLDDDAPPAAPVLQLCVADALNRRFIVARLRREIEQDIVFRVARLLHFFEPRGELRVCVRIVKIACEIEKVLAKVVPKALVERRVFEELMQRFLHLFAKLFVGHRRFESCR